MLVLNVCRYEAGRKEGKYSDEEAKREHAKHSLERYMHYFQRWSENDKSRLQVRGSRSRCWWALGRSLSAPLARISALD